MLVPVDAVRLVRCGGFRLVCNCLFDVVSDVLHSVGPLTSLRMLVLFFLIGRFVGWVIHIGNRYRTVDGVSALHVQCFCFIVHGSGVGKDAAFGVHCMCFHCVAGAGCPAGVEVVTALSGVRSHEHRANLNTE